MTDRSPPLRGTFDPEEILLFLVPILFIPILLLGSTAAAAFGQDASDDAVVGDGVCRIIGRVIDDLDERPIGNASLWLESDVFVAGAGSAADGSFRIETPDCRSGMLNVTMLGYVPAAEPITFDGDGQTLRVTIRLVRDPVEVEALEVEIPTSLRLRDVGFYARKAWEESTGKDLGQFFDREEMEGRAMTGASALAIASSSRIRTIYRAHTFGAITCEPSIYIDGIRYRTYRRGAAMLAYGLRTREVEGIEVYRPIWGAVPVEFRDNNSSNCGAYVVWTRAGRRGSAPRIEVELCEPAEDPLGISFGGIVRDGATGVVLPASYVEMTTRSNAGGPDVIETIADENGEYRFCDLERWPATLQAEYGPSVAEPFAIDEGRAAPGYWAVDLEVPVAQTGAIVGVLTGGAFDPAETEVLLKGHGTTLQPTESGYFEFLDLSPGAYELIVRRGEEVVLRRNVTIRSGIREVLTLELG